MSDCIFCKIANLEIKSDFVFENEHVVAFPDIQPVAPVHVLVVPKQHFVNLIDVNDPTLLGECLLAVQKVAAKVGVNESGYRLVVNNGKDAGQGVFHLHFHIVGGRKLSMEI